MTAVQHLDRAGPERQEDAPAVPERRATPIPQDESRRPSPSGLARELAKRNPATMCFLAVIWVTGLATGSITHGPPQWLSGYVSAGLPSLRHGFWWTPLSAALWEPNLGSYLAITVLCLLVLAPAERRTGVTRTFITLLASQAVGLLLAAGLIRLAGLAHEPWLRGLAAETAVGAVPGLLGVGFELSRTLAPLWRRRLLLLLTTVITISVLYIGQLEQVALACVAAVGLVAVALAYGRSGAWPGLRGPQHDVRVLVSLLVAMPALGGIMAALVTNAHGPIPLSSLPGPTLLLLLCAYGLRRGRRLAWWLAVVINLTVLAASIWVGLAALAGPSVLAARETLALSVVTLIVLLATRRSFDQIADGRAVRKLMASLATALGVSCGAFLVLGFLLRHHSGPRPALGGQPQDLPMRFLAFMLFSDRYLPANLIGRVLYVWVFLLFWIMALGALTAYFLYTCINSDADAADRARAILTRGGSTLSYMSTWPGNAYWLSPDGRAAIAYRAIAGVAVTVGEPYGDPAAMDSAISEFARFCGYRGLHPCLYSVTARANDITQRLGWKSMQIAEDALLPLGSLQFAGKKWQVVRAALNKAAREGITAEWWSYPEMPPELLSQLHEMSRKWMEEKGLPEMNFMLGGLAELNDPNIRCLIAVDADRKLHAITSWMPVYDSGQPIGWTIDLMRRNTEGTVRGVMEFLIATAAMAFQEEGARFVSLSGAPLSGLNRGEQSRMLQRALDMIANTIEPAYGFQSLKQFKDKFQPVYEPLYLTYPDPAALGPIAIAVGSAYLPNLTSQEGLRMLTKLRRRARRSGGSGSTELKPAA